MPSRISVDAVGAYAARQGRLKKNARRSVTLEMRPSLTVGTQTSKAKTSSRTKTTQTKKKTVRQSPTNNDMSTISSKGGHKMAHTLGNAWKLIQKETADIKFSLKAISPFVNAEQAINIDFTQVTANSTFNAPLHMYDVTSCINNQNVGGINANDNITAYSPGYYLVGSDQRSYVSGTGPQYYFNNLSGFAQGNSAGTPVYGSTWVPEQYPLLLLS